MTAVKPSLSGLRNEPLSGNPIVESTVRVVSEIPIPKTLVFLLTLNVFSIAPFGKNNL